MCTALYNILTSQVALGVGCLLLLSPRWLYWGRFHKKCGMSCRRGAEKLGMLCNRYQHNRSALFWLLLKRVGLA
ncbi:hypothetical protein F5B18DRAFT_619283 [Nemania serpens]|nr:hypothetical protein F5B18DRAFT_619283 [Nemania serpens]